MAPWPGFVGGSYSVQSKIAAYDRTCNWIVAKIESGTGEAQYVLDPAPGYAAFCETGTDVGRGAFTLNGVSWAVFGDSLFQLPLTSGGATTLLASGLNNPDNSPVTMAGNGDGGFQLMITSGGLLYCYDLTTGTLTLIPDITATFVVFINAVFVALDPNNSKFYISAPEDGSSWDPLDVEQRSDAPDKWIALTVSHKELWLMGSQTSSVYYNSEGDPPFIPNPSVFITRGIKAPNSLALLNGAPIWLADDLTVRYASGYVPQRISTHAVEYALSQYATVLDADAFIYNEQGHQFYAISFPTAGHSWVYDLTTGLWAERGPYDGLDYAVMDVRCGINAQNQNLVLSRAGSAVYAMSQAFATETDGVTGLNRLRRAPHVSKENKGVVIDTVEIHLEVGIGLATGQGSDPLVALRWSGDGGQTWSHTRTTSAGRIGQYTARVVFRNLGYGRDRLIEVSCSDPIPWRVVDAFMDVRVGAS